MFSTFQIAGPPQRVLSNFLHSFVGSSHGGIPFRPAPLPALGLSEGDKQCIHDRSSIMARHFFADKSEDFINTQVCCCFFVQGELMLLLALLPIVILL
jgi:peroxin-5